VQKRRVDLQKLEDILLDTKKDTVSSRREFIKNTSLLVGSAMFFPNILLSKNNNIKTLQLFDTHIKKEFDILFWENGQYLTKGLDQISQALMDHRSGEIINIDYKLADLLYEVKCSTNAKKPINIYSGYRSPKTNERLRRHRRGVAKHSYHILGQAVDINIPGVSLRRVKNSARNLKAGGVGYYPRSGFVHLDIGPVRHW